MIAQIRSELLKIRTTRTTIGLILGMIALILLITLLTGLLTHASGLGSKEDQRQLMSVGSTAGVFSALAGVLLVTSEYRGLFTADHAAAPVVELRCRRDVLAEWRPRIGRRESGRQCERPANRPSVELAERIELADEFSEARDGERHLASPRAPNEPLLDKPVSLQ